MKATIKKLFRGCIDLRDYNVRECIKNNENYLITFQGENMLITPDGLVNNCRNRQPVSSRLEKEGYELWSYKWEPNE